MGARFEFTPARWGPYEERHFRFSYPHNRSRLRSSFGDCPTICRSDWIAPRLCLGDCSLCTGQRGRDGWPHRKTSNEPRRSGKNESEHGLHGPLEAVPRTIGFSGFRTQHQEGVTGALCMDCRNRRRLLCKSDARTDQTRKRAYRASSKRLTDVHRTPFVSQTSTCTSSVETSALTR